MTKTATIIDAIRRKRMLHLDYHDKSRTVIPHILGYAGTGNLALSAYQVSGTGNGWRMFSLDEIGKIDITGKGFGRPRHDYNPDDPAFDEIIARL
jgi:predicted DNA-binding transcriptional regulator YafY